MNKPPSNPEDRPGVQPNVLVNLLQAFGAVILGNIAYFFLGPLFHKLRSTARKMPGYFREDPVDTFRRHVWINPFWEDDVEEIVRLMGDDRVIFGSDWPHIEGLPEPTEWVRELQKLPEESVPRIMGANVSELNQRRPAR